MAPSRALLEYGANKEDRARFERAIEMESSRVVFTILFFSSSFLLFSRNQELFNSEGNVYRSWGLYKLYKFRGGVFESLEGTRMGQFVWQGLSSMKFPSWENVAFSTVVWYTPGRRCRGGSFINDSLLFLPALIGYFFLFITLSSNIDFPDCGCHGLSCNASPYYDNSKSTRYSRS